MFNQLGLALIIPQVASVLAALSGAVGRRVTFGIVFLTVAVDLGVALALRGGPIASLPLWTIQLGNTRLSIAFRDDGLADLMLVLLAIGSGLVAAALCAYAKESSTGLAVLLLLGLAVGNGLALAANLTTLYVGAELLSLLLFLALVLSDDGRQRLAGLELFATMEIASLPMLAAVAMLAGRGTSDAWGYLQLPGGWLPFGVLLAAAVRLGAVPLHGRLVGGLAKSGWPEASLLALFAPAAGTIVLLRLIVPLGEYVPVRETLLALGIATLAVACYDLLAACRPGQVLAALVLAQAGLLALGLAVDHANEHAATFAQMLAATSTIPVAYIGLGAIRASRGAAGPLTSVAGGVIFAAGVLALAGLPPFYGFFARAYLVQALLASGSLIHLLGLVAVLVGSGVLAAGATRAATLALSEVSSASQWRLGPHRHTLPLAATALVVLVPMGAARWLVDPALAVMAGLGRSEWTIGLSGGLLLLALFAGSLPLLTPGKQLPAPRLESHGGALAALASSASRWRDKGLFDPVQVAAGGVLGLARGVARVADWVFDRLAI